MKSVISPHVWSEILRYFRISFTEDAEEDIDLKRRVMYSVALTCSELVDVALDELWRSMTTLQPVVRVFGISSSSSKPDLGRQDWDGFWNFTVSPDEVRPLIPRIQSYLNRVHYLHFASFPDHRELTLWQALSGLGRFSSLCPNLTRLFLNLKGSSSISVYSLFPLMSSSIAYVTFVGNKEASCEMAASVILTMLNHHGAKLLELSYRCYASSRVFQHITQFRSLHSLTLTPSMHGSCVLEDDHITSLRHLTHLTTLEVFMGMVDLGSNKTMGRELASLDALSHLKLHGTWEEIRDCLFNAIGFNSLRSLFLFFRPPRGKKCGIDIFRLIYSSFPRLRSLLVDDLPDPTSSVTLTDILALKGRPMERISIHNVPIALSTSDVIGILVTWPMLNICRLHQRRGVMSSSRQKPSSFMHPCIVSTSTLFTCR